MNTTGIEGYRVFLERRDGEADLLNRRLDGYCAACCTPTERALMGRLYPRIARLFARQTDEISLLTDREKLHARLDRPFDVEDSRRSSATRDSSPPTPDHRRVVAMSISDVSVW